MCSFLGLNFRCSPSQSTSCLWILTMFSCALSPLPPPHHPVTFLVPVFFRASAFFVFLFLLTLNAPFVGLLFELIHEEKLIQRGDFHFRLLDPIEPSVLRDLFVLYPKFQRIKSEAKFLLRPKTCSLWG